MFVKRSTYDAKCIEADYFANVAKTAERNCTAMAKRIIELRKALDASEQRHTDLADKHNALLAKQPVRGADERRIGVVEAGWHREAQGEGHNATSAIRASVL